MCVCVCVCGRRREEEEENEIAEKGREKYLPSKILS